MKHGRVRSALLLALTTAAFISAAVPRVAQAITPAQCLFFAVDDKVSVCHRTASPKNPYVNVLVTVEACINGFAPNPEDFIGTGDPLCQGASCLPAAAPCDATMECCEGSVCSAGTCQPPPQ